MTSIKHIFIVLVLLMSSNAMCNPPLIEILQGKLQGSYSARDKNIQVYKGIPYAVPPVGARRWKPAEPALSWQGIRLADTYGPDCLGLSSYMNPVTKPEESFDYHPPRLPSEDCLYLNIWTPGKETRNSEKKYPVMVWIHSGAWAMGSGSWPLYDGTELARKGVIVVTFNYRLGMLGFLAHPELSAESPHNASGNYGISDQIQALKWVQGNIAAFGGDPDNVTIFGESAGSASVSVLMASPLAKGLFHRAIGQSSSAFNRLPYLKNNQVGIPSAEAAGENFARLMGCETLEQLRQVPASKVFNTAANKIYSSFANYLRTITVDGWILPDQVYDIFSSGEQNNVPVIVGFNSDESYKGQPYTFDSPETYIQRIRREYGPLAEEYLDYYPPEGGQQAQLHYGGVMGWWMEGWARMMENVSSNAHLYYFSHLPPGAEGAYHTADIAYVFNNEKYSARFSPNMPNDPPNAADLALADTMSNYWVAFAKTGVPAAPEQPLWLPYSPTKKHYMKFDSGVAYPSENLFPGAWELQDKIMRQKNRILYYYEK